MSVAFTIRPTSQGNYSGFSLGAGGSKPAAVSDQSDATYIVSSDNATYTESYVLEDLPAEAGTISGSVTGNLRRVYTGDPPTLTALFRLSGTDSEAGVSNDVSIGNVAAAFASAPGGGAWTVAGVNGLEAGLKAVCGIADFQYCYEIWVTGNYDVQNGGFAFLLQLAGLSSLPLAGAMDVSQFLRYLAHWHRRQSHSIISGDEICRAWAEVKAYRHPTFFLPRFA